MKREKMDQVEISTDKDKIDLDFTHAYLNTTYWARERSMEEVVRSIEHSIAYGVYLNGKQIGFARVLTDYVVFAYIMDVFILDEYRGNGYARILMETMLAHPELQNIKRWFLGTIDAADLYKKFGFSEVTKEIIWMDRKRKS